MTKQTQTPEVLAEQLVEGFYADEKYGLEPGDMSRKIAQAIQQATAEAKEPLEREIVRLQSELESKDRVISFAEREAGNARVQDILSDRSITQLESQNAALQADKALLVEALTLVDLNASRLSATTCDGDESGKTLQEIVDAALTNTTQQAQARDKRLREAVIDEVVQVIEKESICIDHQNPDLTAAKQRRLRMKAECLFALKERITQLKGGE